MLNEKKNVEFFRLSVVHYKTASLMNVLNVSHK